MEASLWSATGQDSSPCRSIARQKGQSETLVNSHATATGEQKGQRPGACATSVRVGGGGRIALEGKPQPQKAVVLAR